jgi:hypothetical protein
VRDHVHTLSDFRVPTLSIECEPCGRHGRYNIARLIAEHGDARLPELLTILADCPASMIAAGRCTAAEIAAGARRGAGRRFSGSAARAPSTATPRSGLCTGRAA